VTTANRQKGPAGLNKVILWVALGVAAGAAGSATAAEFTRAGDGSSLAADAVDRAMAGDSLVASLEGGDRVSIADLSLVADEPSRAMLVLSSEFLTVAVTSGRLRFEEGPSAGPGQALLVALDGSRIQRLAFNAARLSASLSPGARSRLGADVELLVAAQRRAAFWGTYQPLRVNARAQGPAAVEVQRQAYLAQPAIVAQRRAAAGEASVAARGRMAVDAFLAAYARGDAATLAALLDPAPFMAVGGAAAVEQGRSLAAAELLADDRLRALLAAPPAVAMAEDGASALLETGGGRWRLALAPRDRAIFVQSLEPAS